MKALSLRPPWPYAIFHLGKDVENRGRRFDYSGPLLIHASKNWDQKGYEFIIDRMDDYVPSKGHHVFGAIVGRVEMIGCVDWHDSRWFFGDWGYLIENPVEFGKPIPYPGQLFPFDVPEGILEGRIRADEKQARLF